jgi:hypothetical protein
MTAEEKIIEECNEECRLCQRDFQRSEIEFSPTMCKFCPTGQKLHEILKKVTPTEKKWDNLDWNSSQLKDFYHG